MAAVRLIAKVPTLAAFSYRHNMGLPYVYPDNELNYAENFLSMIFKKTEDRHIPKEALTKVARRPLHPPRRPRTELLDQRRARGRLLRRRPLLGGRGRGGGALRAAARRRQRGGAADAAADRVAGEHPRLPRAGEAARGETDGLRPPGLQKLRPAGADHPAVPRRGLRGDRVQPAGRDRAASWRSARSTTTTSPSASSTRTSTSTRGSSTRRWGSRPTCSRSSSPSPAPPAGSPSGWRCRKTRRRKSPGRGRSTPASGSWSTCRSTIARGRRKSSARRRARPKRPRRGA